MLDTNSPLPPTQDCKLFSAGEKIWCIYVHITHHLYVNIHWRFVFLRILCLSLLFKLLFIDVVIQLLYVTKIGIDILLVFVTNITILIDRSLFDSIHLRCRQKLLGVLAVATSTLGWPDLTLASMMRSGSRTLGWQHRMASIHCQVH